MVYLQLCQFCEVRERIFVFEAETISLHVSEIKRISYRYECSLLHILQTMKCRIVLQKAISRVLTPTMTQGNGKGANGAQSHIILCSEIILQIKVCIRASGPISTPTGWDASPL